MKSERIHVSFKTTNQNDIELLLWLEGKFEEFGSKSGYIKWILKNEMKKEATRKSASV